MINLGSKIRLLNFSAFSVSKIVLNLRVENDVFMSKMAQIKCFSPGFELKGDLSPSVRPLRFDKLEKLKIEVCNSDRKQWWTC